MKGENKPPGGMRKHEKKERRYALYEWMWWGVTVGLSRVWTCNTAAFATRCMRLLSAVAQTRCRSDSGLGGGN